MVEALDLDPIPVDVELGVGPCKCFDCEGGRDYSAFDRDHREDLARKLHGRVQRWLIHPFPAEVPDPDSAQLKVECPAAGSDRARHVVGRHEERGPAGALPVQWFLAEGVHSFNVEMLRVGVKRWVVPERLAAVRDATMPDWELPKMGRGVEGKTHGDVAAREQRQLPIVLHVVQRRHRGGDAAPREQGQEALLPMAETRNERRLLRTWMGPVPLVLWVHRTPKGKTSWRTTSPHRTRLLSGSHVTVRTYVREVPQHLAGPPIKIPSMAKRIHEVRDAVHVFVGFDEDEKRVIASEPFQRLRHIHQLALTYNVYPGATHKRFEHSLGVMHLAGRIYDVITRGDKLSDPVRDVVPDRSQNDHGYWRTVVRMAALCHDMGHLPFSHAAEDSLLPDGVDHEWITWEIVHSEPMLEIFDSMSPEPKAEKVGKLAIGPRKAAKLGLGGDFSDWEAILAEVIVGDAFGADRMDYLLRDSLHTGVAYGRFDHDRRIGTLRVMPEPSREEGEEASPSTTALLGCERGGLLAAEQLLLARYFMFSQVYHHPTRLAYNEHLKRFLELSLPGGTFPTDVEGHLSRDDADVLVAIKQAARDPAHPAHDPARRIVFRDHFKRAYDKKPDRRATESEDEEARGDTSADVKALAEAAAQEFGPDNVAYGAPPSKKDPPDFAVYDGLDRSVSWARGLSDVLNKLPESPEEFVLADAGIRGDVRQWLETHRLEILEKARTARIQEAEEEVA